MLQPGVLCPFGKHAKQTSDLDAPAGAQKGHQVSGAQVREPLKDHIQVMEARMTGQFIERLEDGALRRRDLEWPAPGAHRRATAGLRSRDGIELMFCVLDAREIVAEQSARANDKLHVDRQAREPGGNRAVKTDVGLAADRESTRLNSSH